MIPGWKNRGLEWLLNNVANRFQLNYKRNVGATSESIRKCEPNNLEEWREYYYKNVRSEAQIEELGRNLYKRIQTVIKKELDSVTEKDCIGWMNNLVIERVYEGYVREIQVVRDFLQERLLATSIEPASDEWDRLFNVDYYIRVKDKYIGIQIKPLDVGYTQQVFAKYTEIWSESHRRFEDEFGGRVFFVFSAGEKGSKEVQNPEVVEEIKREIERLSGG